MQRQFLLQLPELTRRQQSRSGDVPNRQKRSRRETKPIIQEKIKQETEHIKIHQNQCTNKVADESVAMQRQFLLQP